MFSKKVFWLYFAAMHLVFVALLAFAVKDRISPPRGDNWHQRLHSFYLRYDQNVPSDAILFLGDSHVQGLCTSCISELSVNFGIGKDTIADVLSRSEAYRSTRTAKALIIQAGHNDLKSATNEKIIEDYQSLLNSLPAGPDIVVVAQFPVGLNVENYATINLRKQEINTAVQNLCTQNEQCTMLDLTTSLTDDIDTLSAAYHLGDGIHLGRAGNALWINKVREILADMQ